MEDGHFMNRERFFRWNPYSSFLFLCLAVLAAGLLFVSPFLSLAVLLIGPAAEDYQTGYVDDRWSFLTLVTGVIYGAVHRSLQEGFLSFVCVTLIYGVIFFIAKGKIGTGDIFLSAAIAFWLKPESVFFFIWGSCLVGTVSASVLLFFYHYPKTYPFRFCPCIALGGLGAFVCQEICPAVFTARFCSF